jgi:hypothetical protein
MREPYLAGLAVIAALLAACGGDSKRIAPSEPTSDQAGSGSGGTGTSAGTGGSTSGTTGTSGTSGTSPGGEGGTSGTSTTCAPGIPETSQFPRLLNRQYDAVVRDLLGVTTIASAGDERPSALLYADFDGPVNADVLRVYQDVAEQISTEVMAGANRTKFISCDPAEAGCLRQTIQTFGRKAFRRPLTEAEVARFEQLGQVTPPPTPEELAQTTLFAFLVSPSFLQITELSPEVEGSAIKLSSYEVAARLSFLLWGSIPDDVLDAAADSGELQTKDQILAQAERMIQVREKTAPIVAAYHRNYFDMDNGSSHWWKVSHDTTKYPQYSEALVPALQAELDLFFEDTAFSNGSYKDLFLSNVGFVNRDTAAIYDLDPADYDSELTRVELDPVARPGVLTRAGFLSSYSHFEATAPVLRGAYITVNLLGVNPGPADPAFFMGPPPEGPFYTERAFVEAFTSPAACAGCHVFLNPPGFVLENYDAIGKWQTIDPRAAGDPVLGAIDATATVTFSESNAKTVTGALEMVQEIANTPGVRRIYAEKVVSFATGRRRNPNDACTVDQIDMQLSDDGYTFLNLLADLTQPDSFRLRVRGE